MHRRSWLLLPVVLLLASAFIAFAACGDDDEDESPTATPGATAEATMPAEDTPTAPEATDVPFEGARDPIEGTVGEVPATAPPVATIVRVETGEHEGFDRIVFELSEAGANYTIEYVDGPVGCGTGEAVPLDGEAFLQIRITPAQAHNDAGEATIDASELSPGLPAIVAAVQTCDFEADVTWVVGVSAEADFRVTVLEDPLRLAIDIAHP
jgi:hypothetical protein